MIKGFKYGSAAPVGSYKSEYYYGNVPHYHFHYPTGYYHGIYHFTYGDDKRPIFPECDPITYTYWGRNLSVFSKQLQYIRRELDSYILRQISLGSIRSLGYSRAKENFLVRKTTKYAYLDNLGTLENYKNKEVLHTSILILSRWEYFSYQLEGDIPVEIYKLPEVYIKFIVIVGGSNTRKMMHEKVNLLSSENLKEYNFEHSIMAQVIFPNEILFKHDIALFHMSKDCLAIYKLPTALGRMIERKYYLGKSNSWNRVANNSILYNAQYLLQGDWNRNIQTSEMLIKLLKSHKLVQRQIPPKCGTRRIRRYTTFWNHKLKRKESRIKIKTNPSLLNRDIDKQSILYVSPYLLQREDIKEIYLQELAQRISRAIIKEHIVNSFFTLCNRDNLIACIKEFRSPLLDLGNNRGYSSRISLLDEISKLTRSITKAINLSYYQLIVDKMHEDKELITNSCQLWDKIQNELPLITTNINSVLASDEKIKNISQENIVPLVKECINEIIQEYSNNLGTNGYNSLCKEEDILFNTIEKLVEQEIEYILGHHTTIEVPQEVEISLNKRFWVVEDIDYKDLLILPHDYDYEQEPIEMGNIVLVPDNYHVIYPHHMDRVLDQHPISDGSDVALIEIPVSINIMVDLINIYITLWYKFTPAFWGWTGVQAIKGITNSIFEYITLDGANMNESLKIQYFRAYKWIRWEAEKVSISAAQDCSLNGNYYLGILLEELINYMIDHHFDVVPIFNGVETMDSWRNTMGRTPSGDIKVVLDKLKGIRHKILDKDVIVYES